VVTSANAQQACWRVPAWIDQLCQSGHNRRSLTDRYLRRNPSGRCTGFYRRTVDRWVSGSVARPPAHGSRDQTLSDAQNR
jgi:hypothetical protein